MSTQGANPISYLPSTTPSTADGLPVYLAKELKRVSASVAMLISLTPQVATKAPASPVDGMQRLAVSPWRPVSGQTADRWVTFHGGAWVYSNSM